MVTAKKTAVKKAAPAKKVAPVEVHAGIDWRSLYLYAVCLVTLLVVLFSTVSLVNAFVNFAFPDPAYVDPYATKANMPDPALLQQQEDNSQRQALKNVVTTFTTIAIATPVYLYHWRQARKTSR
ncbi:hypothetical protein MCEMRE130_00443 [Candidatus Nanopelagicaceae bacterium]